MHGSPARAAVPLSPNHSPLHGPDWAMSDEMMRRAADAIISRTLNVCTTYDVPYLAGYSVDGRTIYIDKDVQLSFTDSRGIEVRVDRFLFIHEAVEKALLQAFGLRYQEAHQIALRIEQATCRADGVKWEEYDRFIKPQVKAADEDLSMLLPHDLDLTPYRDSHDEPMLARMRAAMAKKPKA